MPSISASWKKTLQMLVIIVSGEAIFMLPFLIPRLYRPVMLEAWNLTNTQIGTGFAAYGFTSTLSYLLGGAFADKFNPRYLISLSLAATSLVSLFLTLNPSPFSFILTYAFLGVSTVLLMWGALIKTTHVLGGEQTRSTALGILDSGRGLMAALATTALLFLVSIKFPDLTVKEQQVGALNWIYGTVAAFVMVLAATVLVTLKSLVVIQKNEPAWSFEKAAASLKNPQIWLLSFIILSSYCGYKGIDNYSIYFVDVHGLSASTTSQLMFVIIWLRPFSALATGLVADMVQTQSPRGRFAVLTLLLFLCSLTQAFLAIAGASHFYLALSVILTSATFVYGLRAVYFSVFGDLRIPTNLIGTAVGIASFVGFLPDIFLAYISGRLIDANPGAVGFRYTFLFTSACLLIGAISAWVLSRRAQVSEKSVRTS